MPSRKELILYNYTILEKALQKYISKDIFPNLEDNDITDVVYFITMSFLGVDTHDQYNDCIKQHLINNNVKLNEDDCKIVTDLIREFIIWLKTI